MANHTGNYWKGVSDRGTAAFLSTENLGDSIFLLDATTGEVVDEGTFTKTYEDGRYIYRFRNSGANYSNVVIATRSAKMIYIPNGSDKYWNLDWTQGKTNSDDYTLAQNGKVTSKFDTATFPKTLSGNASHEEYDLISEELGISHTGNVATPVLLNSEELQLKFTDPIETMRNVGEANRDQSSKNFIDSLTQAGILSEANNAQLVDYLNIMSAQQQQMVGIENAFNQQQKLQAAETAMPGISDLLRGEIKNAQTLASGKLLSGMEDKALEDTARNAAADQAWARGLGDSSLVGKRLSDQLTLSQRMNVMNQGQNYMSNAVQLATSVLMDTPNKANLSQQISGTPQQSYSNLVNQQQTMLNNLTTMSPESAQSSIVAQRATQLQMDYNVASANAQAMNTFNQDVLNDYNTTNTANEKAKYRQYAALALEKGWIDNDEYQQIRDLIDTDGYVDMGVWIDDWDEKYNRYIRRRTNADEKEQQGLTNSESTNSTSQAIGDKEGSNSHVTKDEKDEGSKSPTTDEEDNTGVNKVLKTSSSSGGVNKIYNSTTGTITIPTFNKNFSNLTTYIQYLQAELADIDLKGVI